MLPFLTDRVGRRLNELWINLSLLQPYILPDLPEHFINLWVLVTNLAGHFRLKPVQISRVYTGAVEIKDDDSPDRVGRYVPSRLCQQRGFARPSQPRQYQTAPPRPYGAHSLDPTHNKTPQTSEKHTPE